LSLYIEHIPPDLGAHYPDDYYSFSGASNDTAIKLWAKRKMATRAVTGTGLAGQLLARILPEPMMVRIMRFTGTQFNDAILDVGCGNGAYLRDLEKLGFTQLTGADPFLKSSGKTGKNIQLLNKELRDVENRFDLIMFNHAFEHIANPEQVLRDAGAKLADGGAILIRVPVAQSDAWHEYGVNWIQLDAPRHLHIASVDGMQKLAEKTSFKLEKTAFDSDAFMFWGSELYKRDIPLQKATQKGGPQQFLSPDELKAFQERADASNRQGTGDQAGFLLRKLA
jgi:SAM-dependent methyltransferase